jgi:hypothetical protein
MHEEECTERARIKIVERDLQGNKKTRARVHIAS